MAGKTSVASQRILAIGTVLLATVWSLSFIATVNGQSPPGTATSSQGIWTMKAPLPAPRAEVAAVAFDGKLHALGGSVSGTAGPYHDEYDPATNSWRARAPLPEGRDHLGVAVAADKIFAFGGFVGSVHKGAGTGAFEYDPKADTWRVLPPMKGPRGSVGAATVDGKIHVIGGRGLDGVVVATHEVFDPQSGQWSEAAPLPTPRDHLVVIAVERKNSRHRRPLQGTGRPHRPARGVRSGDRQMDVGGSIADAAQRPSRRLLSRHDPGARRRAAARPHVSGKRRF